MRRYYLVLALFVGCATIPKQVTPDPEPPLTALARLFPDDAQDQWIIMDRCCEHGPNRDTCVTRAFHPTVDGGRTGLIKIATGPNGDVGWIWAPGFGWELLFN